MSRNDRLLWRRDEGCKCGAKLRGEELEDGTGGPLRLTREVRVECPRHGASEAVVDAAVDAAEAVLSSVPGLPRIARPQLRRLVLAALPVVVQAIGTGALDHLLPAPGAGSGNGPGTGGGTGAGDGSGGANPEPAP